MPTDGRPWRLRKPPSSGDTLFCRYSTIYGWNALRAISYNVPFQDTDSEATVDDIMDAIITLDDQYKNGDLPEGAYQTRRKELKDRLKDLLGN